MRSHDDCDVDLSVAVKITHPQRIEPTVSLTNELRGAEPHNTSFRDTKNRERSTLVSVTLNHEHLVPAITIEIDQPYREILEHPIPR